MSDIISVSRRTDVPACHADKFMECVRNGYIIVGNKDISLLPEDVICFVFWTKNPRPLIPHLKELDKYMYYFQFTLTSYGKDIEPNIPLKLGKGGLVETFIELSKMIGKARVIWRYDPIMLTSKYDIEYHMVNFELLASLLDGYTEKCVISFLDVYGFVRDRVNAVGYKSITFDEKRRLVHSLKASAREHNMELAACAETGLVGLVEPNKCVDDVLISRLLGWPFDLSKDPTQRKLCGCVTSIDIGTYGTCNHGCVYCYATK